MKVKNRFPNVCLLDCLSLSLSLLLSVDSSNPCRFLEHIKQALLHIIALLLFCFGFFFLQKMDPDVPLKISTLSDVTEKSTCALQT